MEMKKVKAVCWLLIIGLIVMVVLQNKTYFWAPQSLGINLYFSKFATPALPNGTFIVTALLIGFLVAYFISLPERFKARKTIKEINATNAANLETLTALKNEIEKQQAQQTPEKAVEVPAGEPEADPAQEAAALETKTDKAETENNV